MTSLSALFTPMLAPVFGAIAQHADQDGHGADVAHGAGGHDVAHAVEAPAGMIIGDGSWLVPLIPLMPIIGVIAVTICAIRGVKTKLPAWITVGCLGLSFLLTLAVFAGGAGEGIDATVSHGFQWINLSWGHDVGQTLTANFSFYVDSLTLLWMLFVTGLATLIALYASEYMSHDVGTGFCRFFAAFNLFVFSMACLVMGDNLILLYLGWEGVGLCSYLLIGYFYQRPSAVAAAKKAFIVNRIGDLGLALGIMLTFVHFGTVEYKELFGEGSRLLEYVALAQAGDFAAIPGTAKLIALFLMAGAFGKSAQFPLYVWLPDAMEGPTPVSALIHAATMVTAGLYLIARTYWLFAISPVALPIVAWVGAITALLAATIGMAQFDIKRIMAYSTCSQLGYMFAGLGFLTPVGAASHVFTHAFFKALLFLACGAVMHGFAGQLDLRKLSGLQKVPGWRIVGLTMLVGCLNLAGVPIITAGFWSKDMIMAEAFVNTHAWFPFLGMVLVLTAGLTAYYTFRVYFRVFVGPVEYHPGDEVHDDHDDHAHEGSHEFHPHAPGPAINFVLITLAVLSFLAIPFVTLGEYHGWVGGQVHHSTAHYEVAHAEHHAGFFSDPHQWMLLLSSVVGIIGIAIAWMLHYAGRTEAATSKADGLLPALGPIPTWAQNKWYVDEFYDFLIRRPLWVLSTIFYYIDALLVDGLVNFFGWFPRMLGRTIRPSQSGILHGYALGMAGGVAILAVVVWWVI